MRSFFALDIAARNRANRMKKVAVIMGSESDLPIVEKGIQTLVQFGAPFEAHVYSAHRTPEAAKHFAETARAEGFGVIIAAAGKAAHLAGVLAASTTLPVIGIPIASGGLGGMDALLSTIQMPPGVPVAAVGVDAAKNAALLALEILAVEDEALQQKLAEARVAAAEGVERQNQALQERFGGGATGSKS